MLFVLIALSVSRHLEKCWWGFPNFKLAATIGYKGTDMTVCTLDYLEKNLKQVLTSLRDAKSITVVSAGPEQTVICKILPAPPSLDREQQKNDFVRELNGRVPVAGISWTREDLLEAGPC